MKMPRNYIGKKVLVTGGAGFTGSHLIKELLELGAHVRTVEYKKKILLEGPPTLEILKGDLRDRTICDKAVKGMDYVFHCAATSSGAYDIIKTPVIHITPNMIINVQLFEAAAFAGVKKLLTMSSSTVYPDETWAMKEDDVWKGEVHSTYEAVGWMKRYMEKLCVFYHNHFDMDTCVVRPANIFGPGDDFDLKTAHVIPSLINKIVSGQNPLEVWGTGEDVRDFIYIDDIVRGMLLAMQDYCCGKSINICSGKLNSVKDILNKVIKICDVDIKLNFDTSKPSTIPIRALNGDLAKEVLGFECEYGFEEGLEKTVKWYKENR